MKKRNKEQPSHKQRFSFQKSSFLAEVPQKFDTFVKLNITIMIDDANSIKSI